MDSMTAAPRYSRDRKFEQNATGPVNKGLQANLESMSKEEADSLRPLFVRFVTPFGIYSAHRERDVRGPRLDARDAFRAANEKSHLLPWSHP
jgi:hypothetical protein